MIGCVASKTMEDFTALLEMHPLKHMTLGRERESTPYPPMILFARRMVRRGQSYAVDSKRSIDLKTQICCPRVDQVLRSAEAFFYQQMISSWFGRFFKLGRKWESTPYPPMILYARRMVRRGQSYAVNSEHSIDFKTQFVAHMLIRYSILPRPSFINK